MGPWVRVGLAALLVAAAAALPVAGCGGSASADDDLRVLRLGAAEPGGRHGDASPGPGRTVLRFVRAARRGHARELWSLLSEATRAGLGPTFAQFEQGTARRLWEDFADFRGAEVLLSRRLAAGWGVGAVVGRYEDEEAEPEPAAYAAAVRREAGGWRIELGGVVIGRVQPVPNGETDGRPELRAEAATGGEIERLLMWVDRRPVEALPSRLMPFTAQLHGAPDRALPLGLHTVVVFAAGEDAAGALAWPFEVVED